MTSFALVLFSFFFYFCCLYKPNEITILFFIAFTIKASQEMLIIFNQEKRKKDSRKHFLIIFLTVLFFLSVFIFLYNTYPFLDKKEFSFNLFNLFNLFDLKKYHFFLLLLPLMLLLLSFVFLPTWNTADLGKTLLIMFYIGISMACLLTLILLPGRYLFFFVLIVVLTDSCAFLARFKNFLPFLNLGPLVPHLSPQKTKKGAILGTFGSVIITTCLFVSFNDNQINSFPLFIFFAFLISIISQISDLLASKFKREFQIKDFGNIFPGHGGMLDRFDSWLLTAFFALFCFHFPFL
ncbi:phosphatidate cytidylyltransferase [Candidatus Phytoplasma solani]